MARESSLKEYLTACHKTLSGCRDSNIWHEVVWRHSNHLHAEGQVLFHLLCTVQLGTWVQQGTDGPVGDGERNIHEYHTFNNTTSTVLSTLEMSHKLYRLLWRSYILSRQAGVEQQSPPWTPGWPRPGALQTSHIRAQRSPRVSACPSLLAGKRKSQSCDQLIKSSQSRFARTGNTGTYSKQKIFEESFRHIGLFWFATAKNGISLPVRVITIIKKRFSRQLWHPKSIRMKILPEEKTKARCVQQEPWRSEREGRR